MRHSLSSCSHTVVLTAVYSVNKCHRLNSLRVDYRSILWMKPFLIWYSTSTWCIHCLHLKHFLQCCSEPPIIFQVETFRDLLTKGFVKFLMVFVTTSLWHITPNYRVMISLSLSHPTRGIDNPRPSIFLWMIIQWTRHSKLWRFQMVNQHSLDCVRKRQRTFDTQEVRCSSVRMVVNIYLRDDGKLLSE